MSELLTWYQKVSPGEIFLTHLDDDSESRIEEWKNSISEQIRDKFIITYDELSASI